MDQIPFDAKCRVLQHIYLHLSEQADWIDFADEYYFSISLADVIASGEMIELSEGGVAVIEAAFDGLTKYAKNNTHIDMVALLKSLSQR